MHLVFSWFANSGASPEHPGAGAAVLDREVVGPLRLLDHVETMLGLGRPQTAAVKRIAIFQRKLVEAGAGRFWSKSFAVDPWSTTRELLSWRDELIEAGWRPGLGLTRSRLADLSAAETSGPELPQGQADRLRSAIDELEGIPSLRLSSIMLVDDRNLLPTGWRRLLDALERCGVRVEQIRQPDPPALDQRLTLLSADTEIVAAEALAAWLAADPAGNGGLVFVLGKDTSLLDHALAKTGLPRLGKSSQSPHRALLQALPLAFALAWDPPDPNRLLDFLLLPIGPIPRRHANRLAGVVAAQPGVGGDEWLAAWVGIETSLAEEESADPKKNAKRIAKWRAFVEPSRHDPKAGMPRSGAMAVADRVGAWAQLRQAAASDDGDAAQFRLLANASSDLSEAIDTLEEERLDRVLIERMIEQALGDGASDPLAVAEAAPWRTVSHPGAIWGEARTIVWWHFADAEETSAAARWNGLERIALAEAGCPLDERERELELLAAAWERPLRYARERILFVRPTFAAGAESSAHPLWHSLAARHRDLAREISIHAETVLNETAPSFAGRELVRSLVEAVPPLEPRRIWKAPVETVAAREFESASSLSMLLSCPLQWTLRHACRLRPGVRQSVPDLDRLVGIVAHRIVQDALVPGAPPSPETIGTFAERRFEELLPQIAATLLLPGVAGELAAARRALPAALAELARFLQAEKLTVIAVEAPIERPNTLAPGVGVRGSIDLHAVTASGRPVIVDLKWYFTDSYMRRELENGVALQLGVYAHHVDDGGADDGRADVAAGYFMLRQKRFLTATPLGGGAATTVDGPTPKETWEKVLVSFGAAMQDIRSGDIRAAIEHDGKKPSDFSDPYLLTPPRCGHCDYYGICGAHE